MKSVSVHKAAGHTFAMDIDNGRHDWLSDEDIESGGEDFGPQAYELLLSALGACTAITLLMYAERKGWNVYDVAVVLTQDKVDPAAHPVFSPEEASQAGPSGRLDVIELEVRVRGDLDQAQLDRLLEIANRCPIHRTLEARPKILSAIKRAD
jgi:putative redox protein